MTSSELTLKITNKLAVITINRPSRKNAMNAAIYFGLTRLLNEISVNNDVTVTAITGVGDFFSSGNDLSPKEMLPKDDQTIEEIMAPALARVRNFVEAFINHSKVLVAVVNGPAVGIATTILPLCDIVYCTPEAWFQTPFTKLGICAEAGSSYTFPRIFGPSLAGEMLYFNRKLSSSEAAAAGLVARVIPRNDLEEEVWKPLRVNAAELSPKSLAATKQLMRRFDEQHLHEANRMEVTKLSALFQSEEAMQALLKFSSRRSNL